LTQHHDGYTDPASENQNEAKRLVRKYTETTCLLSGEFELPAELVPHVRPRK
jgi:hypothetical protein